MGQSHKYMNKKYRSKNVKKSVNHQEEVYGKIRNKIVFREDYTLCPTKYLDNVYSVYWGIDESVADVIRIKNGYLHISTIVY